MWQGLSRGAGCLSPLPHAARLYPSLWQTLSVSLGPPLSQFNPRPPNLRPLLPPHVPSSRPAHIAKRYPCSHPSVRIFPLGHAVPSITSPVAAPRCPSHLSIPAAQQCLVATVHLGLSVYVSEYAAVSTAQPGHVHVYAVMSDH